MELDTNPQRNRMNGALVRNALLLLAAGHPTIKPDDVVALPDQLVDWNTLVENEFPREWHASALRMQEAKVEVIAEDGRRRLRTCFGARTLEFLVEDARKSQTSLEDLRCAAITIGNLIEDQVAASQPEVAKTIQLQINSFYNAAANQAFADAGFCGPDGKILAILPEYNPKVPDTTLDEEG